VLLAMGYTPTAARSAIRFSLGWASSEADVDAALERVPAIVRRLRG
jgi:cysteine desulfurase